MKDNDICRYCGGVIKLVPAQAVYGESTQRLGMTGEYIYQCQNCQRRRGFVVFRRTENVEKWRVKMYSL